MSIYIELLLLTAVVVFIVDLSGWTPTWLGWLSRFTQKHGLPAVKSLRPFSCSLCMSWWCCLLWCLVRKDFTLPVVAYSAAMAYFSKTIADIFIFLGEGMTFVIRKAMQIWDKD